MWDRSKPSLLILSDTADEACHKLLSLIAPMYESTPQTPKIPSASAFFGYGHPVLKQLLEQQPEAQRCDRYQFQYQDHLVATANISGCARTERFKRQRVKGPAHLGMTFFRECPMMQLWQQIRLPKDSLSRLTKEKLAVQPSPIHMWGVNATQHISKGEMVLEYKGELIRATVADVREKTYKLDGGTYMFRIDGDSVVDATVRGNMARFINHSCDPNCKTEIVVNEVENQKHIRLYAKRNIQPNEELAYDYHFALGEDKVACHCGAENCMGRMN